MFFGVGFQWFVFWFKEVIVADTFNHHLIKSWHVILDKHTNMCIQTLSVRSDDWHGIDDGQLSVFPPKARQKKKKCLFLFFQHILAQPNFTSLFKKKKKPDMTKLVYLFKALSSVSKGKILCDWKLSPRQSRLCAHYTKLVWWHNCNSIGKHVKWY